MMNNSSFSIGQLAKAADTKAATIRYYEQMGLLSSAARTDAGYRIYTTSERDRLLFIRRARSLGFTLDDIKELLGFADQRDSSCDVVDAKVGEQLAQVRARIRDLSALQTELERLSGSCKGGAIGQCQIIGALSGA